MSEIKDEYGVYERLAVLETEVRALKDKPLPVPPASPFSNPIAWVLIAATALGNGPQVLEIIAKVLLK